MRPSERTTCILQGGPENGAVLYLQKYTSAYYVEGADGSTEGTYHDTLRVVNGHRVFRYEKEII